MTLQEKLLLDVNTSWLEGVRQIASPNFDARPPNTEISLLVVHAISLPPGKFGGDYIDRLFCNRLDKRLHPYFEEIADLKVSAHAFINREGGITQYVPFAERAWHAGVSEFNGRQCCNDFSIGIELEGCDEQPYTDEQYLALAAVTRILRNHWPEIVRENIVGHCHISPGRKTDPGPLFDWQRFYDELEKQNKGAGA